MLLLPNEVMIQILRQLYCEHTKNLIDLFRLRRVNRQFKEIASYLINKSLHIKIPSASMVYRHRRVLKFFSEQYLSVGFYYDSTIQHQTFCDLITKIMSNNRIKTMMYTIKPDQIASFFFPIRVGFCDYVCFCNLTIRDKKVYVFRFF